MTLVLFVFSLALAAFAASSSSEDMPVNIIMVLVDDLGYNNVEWNPGSYAKTPKIAQLRSEGLHLSQHYVQRWCTPTRASLMTGRYPYRVGWNQFDTNFTEERAAVPLAFDMLPKVLKKANYRSYMLGKWHLGHYSQSHTPVGRGFDRYFGFFLGSATHDTHNSWGKHTCDIPVTDLYNDTRAAKDSPYYQGMTYSPYMYTEEAVKIIEDHAVNYVGQPMFLYLATQNNHAPYTAAPEYMEQFPDLPSNQSRQIYNAMMLAVDDMVGNVTEALRKHPKFYENRTVIVFTADNGGPQNIANNLPLRGAKFSVFEGGLRTNAFLWAPGVLPDSAMNQSYDGLVHICDWYATFAALGGIENINGFQPDGVNQWPAFSSVGQVEQALQDSPPRSEIVHDLDPIRGIWALRSGDYKVIYGNVGVDEHIEDQDWDCSDCCPLRYPPLPPHPTPNLCDAVAVKLRWEHPAPQASICHNRDSPCLFDLRVDPNEYNDLAQNASYSSILESLLKRMDYYANLEWTQAIDVTKYSQDEFCSFIKRDQWVIPYDDSV